jgi:hypothetical protein
MKCNLTAGKGLTVENVRNIDYAGLHTEVKEGQMIINK